MQTVNPLMEDHEQEIIYEESLTENPLFEDLEQ